MKIVLFIGILFISLFAKEVDLPLELNAWKSLSYVNAAKNTDELANAVLTLNTASFVELHNTPKVTYAIRAEKEGGTVSYGGIFQIEIKEKGIYRIALANASWVDVIKDLQPAKSIAHKGGPENTGIHKMLDYSLEAGVYIIQLSAGGDSTTALLVSKIK
jgi:hypothetical protein